MVNEKRIIARFSEELASRMQESGITDRDMALYCRISEANLPGYRNGERLPNPWYLVLMAERLDCSVNDLLGFDETEDHLSIGYFKASDTFSAKNPFEVHLSRNIVRIMNNRNISIEALADYSGVGIGTLKHWLAKHPTLPRSMQLLAICSALECTPSELLGY